MSDTCKSFCRTCKREQKHTIVAKHAENGHEEKYDVTWWNSYEVIQCGGCDTISFRRVHSNTDLFDGETGELEESIEIYPDPTKHREPIPDSDEFPALTRRVYLETLTAISNNAPILAAIGIRAIIESVCKDLATGKNNLAKNIDALADLGHLSKAQADMLHNHRFMGNVAAHEIQPPNPSNLIAALEIAETLLRTIYVLPKMAAKLQPPTTINPAQQGGAGQPPTAP
jgi:hypothetical protein